MLQKCSSFLLGWVFEGIGRYGCWMAKYLLNYLGFLFKFTPIFSTTNPIPCAGSWHCCFVFIFYWGDGLITQAIYNDEWCSKYHGINGTNLHDKAPEIFFLAKPISAFVLVNNWHHFEMLQPLELPLTDSSRINSRGQSRECDSLFNQCFSNNYIISKRSFTSRFSYCTLSNWYLFCFSIAFPPPCILVLIGNWLQHYREWFLMIFFRNFFVHWNNVNGCLPIIITNTLHLPHCIPRFW